MWQVADSVLERPVFPGCGLSPQVQVIRIGKHTGIVAHLHLSKVVCIQDSEKTFPLLSKIQMRDEMLASIDTPFLLNTIGLGILPDELDVPLLAPIR